MMFHTAQNEDYAGPNTFCAKQMFLASALYDGLEDCNIRHLKTILEKTDANPNAILPNQGISPFHLGVGNESEGFALEVTRLFLQHGGNPNVRSVDKQTPVHIAAAWGRLHIFHLLLLNGGDPWIHDCDGNNAFHYAYKEHHWKVVEVLQRFWQTNSCKEDDLSDEKYTLTFEKVFVYGSNIAYEYGMDSQSAARCLRTVSVNTQTCTSSGSVSEMAKDGNNHEEPCEVYVDQTSVFKDEGNGCCGVSTQACQECCVSVKDIVVNVCAENRSCRTTVNSKSVNEEDLNTDDITVKRQMHAVTHENGEGILEKRREWVNSCNTFDTDFRTEFHKELKFDSSGIAEQISHDAAAKFVQEWLSGYPSPEGIVEESLNIVNNNEHLPLKCEEGLKVDNTDSFQVMEASNDVSQTKTNVEDHRKPIVTRNTKNATHLAPNVPVNVVPPGDSCRRRVCCGSVGREGRRGFQSESNREIKWDRTVDRCGCGSDSRCGSSPELICEEEWIASQSCFVLSESSDYVTCDDTCPVVTMTGGAFQKEGQNTDCLESNIPNCNDKVRLGMSSSSSSSSESADSFMSLSEEYKYLDQEEGVVLLERRFLVPTICFADLQSEEEENKITNPPQPSRPQDAICSSGDSTVSDVSVPSSLDYDTDILRGKLKDYGYIPGPIVTTTKRLYLRKLLKIQKKPFQLPTETRVYSPELQRTVHNFNLQNRLPEYKKLEDEVIQQFLQPEPLRRWRGGIVKSSFAYLLLDPRVTNNLPCRVNSLSDSDAWSTFLSSIFYIGKGKRSRPYSHLYQAFAVWKKEKKKKTVEKVDKKVQFILDIWKAGMGVVCLHVFQNVMPVEAYTREAAMIDAIELRNLENARRGDYYGVAATWTSHHKRMLGTYLLYRAMCIFIHEGERQLSPGDLG